MSACTHPTSALYVDRQQGKTICTICGDVVMEDQFELDPVFAQSGSGGGGQRPLPGSFRPASSAKAANSGLSRSHARPTIDKARREMLNIARLLDISDETVERALGVYKVALNMNAVSGTRPSVLCACLYAACRRERTSHVIYDFSNGCNEDPHAILTQMKLICHATHTEVPVVDPSCYVQRFAEEMDLREKTAEVIVCALKVLRAMQDDWISCGRRPMGVCAAALLVACYVFGILRTPEQVCGMVRLTSNTISKRLNEFAATPTAALESIDDYQPSSQTLPPAFNDSSRKSTEEDVHASMRELSAIFYELVTEAKTSQPATPERCDKWRRFIFKHCELEGITPLEENLDLTGLTPEQQLHILGLPHTKPIPQEEVERSVKEEEHKLLVKREDSLQRSSEGDAGLLLGGRLPSGFSVLQGLHPSGFAPHAVPDGDTLASSLANATPHMGDGAAPPSSEPYGLIDPATAAVLDAPEQLQWMTDEYTRLLNSNAEVMQLRNDFDFMEDEDEDTGEEGQTNDGRHRSATTNIKATQNEYGARVSAVRGTSPPPDQPNNDAPGEEALFNRDDESMRLALADLLYDRERRHALPWEFLVLPRVKDEDCTDILPYLVLDNEERLRRERIGLELYREKWMRGRARTQDEIDRLEEARETKRRRRGSVAGPAADVPSAMERALRGRGAGTVNISQIEELLPGMLEGGEDEVNAEWD
ncbi:putative transcription factor [Leptomonas pyrrhocoris]|uniref:Putative transcription factor n=1 Tax=Leptomonas pyrrhocoris TaxID=157538 RepID=A0A0M9FZZ6_LEPPY|nr:putative transcription factor [Leptomonas pyrrhocoris]KPA79443.1 putative transcription factor [Leptomonas pyrrhocoris]|eukprot:XP_015657882.1 putative transcription factor [Leptomonas pyrrhocoris]